MIINRDTEDLAHDNDKTSISLFIQISLFCCLFLERKQGFPYQLLASLSHTT